MLVPILVMNVLISLCNMISIAKEKYRSRWFSCVQGHGIGNAWVFVVGMFVWGHGFKRMEDVILHLVYCNTLILVGCGPWVNKMV